MTDDEYCTYVETQAVHHLARCGFDDVTLKINDIVVACNDFAYTLRREMIE